MIGKTEGNGGVNDFTRILADQAFRRVLLKHGKRSEAEIAQHPDGVVRRLRRRHHAARHGVRAQRQDRPGVDKSRLAIGTALSAELLPEDIGRPAMVEKVADAVKAAMKDAGITDPKDVHYVQTKTPLLTIDSVRDAETRGTRRWPARCTIRWACRTAPPRSASPWRSARCTMPKAEEICKDLDLYSSVASCSSGVELTQAQIVLLGNKAGAGGRYRIGHSVMKDALDIDGIYDSIRDAGLELPERPRVGRPQGPRRQLLHEMRGRPHAARCAGGGRSCSTIPTSIITAIPRPRSAASRRGDRRSGGVRLGRRHAPGPAWRRPGASPSSSWTSRAADGTIACSE